LADPTHLKQLGVGAATTGGLYGLSWLLPGARRTHGLRLLASILAGGTAGYYGDNILNWMTGHGFATDEEKANENAMLEDTLDYLRKNPDAQKDPTYAPFLPLLNKKNASTKARILNGILAKHGL